MRPLIEFLFVNAFLLLLILVGAGAFLALGSIINALHMAQHSPEAFALYACACVVAVWISYHTGKRLHQYAERRIRR